MKLSIIICKNVNIVFFDVKFEDIQNTGLIN